METNPLPGRRGRPPKQSHAYPETREALIRVGVAALTEHGFHATAIDDVLRQVGVPKGSFYHYFASKEAFGADLIAAYAGFFARKLDRFFTDGTRSPLNRFIAFTDDAMVGMARYDYRRGCLVGNLGQEMGLLPAAYRAQLTAIFTDWQARTAACFRAAQAAGEIAADRDCDQLAAFFWIGWEGAVLRAKLDGGPEALMLFVTEFLRGVAR